MTPPINSVSDEVLAELLAYEGDLYLSRAAQPHIRSILTELAARRAANTPVDGVSIKPLEWGDHDSLSIIAHTVLGPYLVEVINSPRVALWLPNMTGQARKMIEGFDSVEDAKAAAQADFNARIRSCLTSPAAEPVADAPVVARLHWKEGLGPYIEGLPAKWDVGPGLFELRAHKVANADGSALLAALPEREG